MIARRVPLCYDKEFDRWTVEVRGQRYGLHCGETFKLHLGNHAMPCRIESGNRWYLITEDAAFGLLSGRKYTVTIDV